MDSLYNDIDHCEPLINGINDDHKIIKQNKERYSTEGGKSLVKEYVFLISMIIIFVLSLMILLACVGTVIYFIHLFESGKIAEYIELDTQTSEVGIVPGHYVLVQYDIKEDSATKIIGNALRFSLNFTSSQMLNSTTTTDYNYTAAVYKTDCSSSIEVQPFCPLQPTNRLFNFTSCVDQTCFFDQYVYEVPSEESTIVYNITNEDYNVEEPSEFLILAYQQRPTSFSSSIKSAHMNTRKLSFSLDSNEIRKSTYYFFAIQLISGPQINKFTIIRSGVQVFYNVSQLSPLCTFNVTTSCSFTIGHENDRDCIFTHFDSPPIETDGDDLASEDPYNQKVIPFRVSAKSSLTTKSYSIIGIVITVMSVPSIIFGIMILCSIRWIKRKKKTLKEQTNLIDTESRQSVVHHNFELTVSNEICSTSDEMSQTYCSPQFSSKPNEKTAKKHQKHCQHQKLLESSNNASNDEGYFPDTAENDQMLSDSSHGEKDDELLRVTPDDILVNDITPTPTVELTSASSEISPTRRKLSQTHCTPQLSNKPNDKDMCGMPIFKTIKFDERGRSFRINQYGAIVVIPQGAVKGPTQIYYKSSPHVSGFKCEGSYEPVSSFTYMQISEELLKPVQVYIPINVVADDTKGLVLLCKGHEENAVFKAKHDVSLSMSRGMVCFELSHFCEICISEDRKAGRQLERKYNVAIFSKSVIENNVQKVFIGLVVICSMGYLEDLKQYYTKKCYTYLGVDQLKSTLTEKGIELSHSLPEHSQWKAFPIGAKTKITVSDTDVYEFLGCDMENFDLGKLREYQNEGTYPPRFNLVFHAKAATAELESATIFINAELDSKIAFQFKIILEPQSISTENTRTMVAVSSHDDSFTELRKYVEPVLLDEYYNFGLALGIELGRMDNIEQSTNYVPYEGFSEVLLEWKKNSETLKTISEAVKKCNYPIFSSFIAKRFPSIAAVPQDYVTIEQTIPTEPLSDRDISLGLETVKEHLSLKNVSVEALLHAKPEIKDFLNLVIIHIPNKWKMFGRQVKISSDQLEAIDQEERGDSQECFMKTIDKWKKANDPPFQWETVIKVLYSPFVRRYGVCEKICQFLKEQSNTEELQ